MHKETAETIAAELRNDYGLLPEVRVDPDAPSDEVRIAVPTPFVTPDGRTPIMLYVTSGSSGDVYMWYGDDAVGIYADEPLTFTGMTDKHPAGHAASAAATLAGRPLQDEWDAGLQKAYADAIGTD